MNNASTKAVNKFSALCDESKAFNETNDCAVKAISIACRISYKEAHALCAKFGRKNRRGMKTNAILEAVKSLGCSLVEKDKYSTARNKKTGCFEKCGYTVSSIGPKIKRGYHLVFVRGHVLACVNGQVADWTEGRKHHVIKTVKVFKTREG